ncbi:hypothetical protein OWV82_002997 [Melia azedarach]|uniref:Uncharacterized protein n=1 Tax=Melia azedarach TaxID=155640 RepID=A0ACC1Z3K1_MELAZ|nr:hypothetical protein OWV82_002997 [Melia azedarach]
MLWLSRIHSKIGILESFALLGCGLSFDVFASLRKPLHLYVLNCFVRMIALPKMISVSEVIALPMSCAQLGSYVTIKIHRALFTTVCHV